MEVGGWVHVSLGFCLFGKSSQNSAKTSTDILDYYTMCIHSVCIYSTLIKVVGYYDLSVLSMTVMGFQKNKVWMGLGGWCDWKRWMLPVGFMDIVVVES